MGKRLYVKNIPWGTTEESLAKHFEQCGSVTSVTIINDRETGRSKGFCFVEMEDGAEKAIQTLNGVEFEGRSLLVNEARPREERSGGNFNRDPGHDRGHNRGRKQQRSYNGRF